MEVGGIPLLHEWGHVAAVTGKDGGKLYFNGTLVATNDYTGSLSELGRTNNFLGRADATATNAFRGELDEVRIWKGDPERRADSPGHVPNPHRERAGTGRLL